MLCAFDAFDKLILFVTASNKLERLLGYILETSLVKRRESSNDMRLLSHTGENFMDDLDSVKVAC